MLKNSILARLSGAVAIVIGGSVASAATLVDYKPFPASPTTPEFVFNGPVGSPSLQSGPGSLGNFDGTLPVANQTPGGLDAETPFVINGVPGSEVNLATGTTLFHDTTLLLNGLVANAPAASSGSLLIQSLGAGSFSMFSTDPDGILGPLTPTLLLSGNIAPSSFIAGTGNAAGEFNSLGITYTAGVIYTAMLAAGGQAAGNSMSISMVDVTPNLAIDNADGDLADFTANATGLFSYVPEPGSASLFGAATVLAGLRRKRRD